MKGWMRSMHGGRWLAMAITSSLVACGGSEGPDARTPDDVAGRTEDGSQGRHTMSASSEIGALDEAAVTAEFSDALGDLQRCLDQGAERVEFIGGEIAFFIKIDRSGRLSHAHAERSTLGDRSTERCMLDALRTRTWPPPKGGDTGLARNSFDFDMQNDVRPPTEWDGTEVESTLSDLRTDIAECKASARGSFTATMYVDTEGNALSVGIAPSDESGEQAADCLADVLGTAQYPSPGSWPAKVTFNL